MTNYINVLMHKKSHKTSHKKQRGSALMLAIFVIIVILLLGITLVEILSTGNEAVSQEVLGTRALTAANSGMQRQLQVLFPLDGSEGECLASLPPITFIGVDGLSQCQASVICEHYATTDEATINEVKYYRLESLGECGTGTMGKNSKSIVLSNRTVIVEARSL